MLTKTRCGPKGRQRGPAPGGPLARFQSCATGATAIEYAMMAALLAIAAITGLHAFGSSMTKMYETIGSAVNKAQ